MKRRRKLLEEALTKALAAVQEDGKDINEALAEFPALEDELRPRLEAALWLQGQKSTLDMRPGYQQAAQRRLVAQARQASPSRFVVFFRRMKRFSQRFQWIARTVLVGFLLLAYGFALFQVSDLSQAAIPGDSLYPLKLFIEQARLTVSLDPVQDARLQVEFSRRRSDEIAALIFEGRFDLLQPTVQAFEQEVSRARLALRALQPRHRSQAVALSAELSNMVESQNVILGLLIQAIPEEARIEVRQAMKVSYK